MRNICTLNLANMSCCGVLTSATGTNEIIIEIIPLINQIDNFRIEITKSSGGTVTVNANCNMNVIRYTVPFSYYSAAGTMRIRLLSNQGNSGYIDFDISKKLSETDNVKVQLNSDNMSFIISSVVTMTTAEKIQNLDERVTFLEADQKLLWSGSALWMNENQKIVLSEPWTDQKNGIVLVWSAYEHDTMTTYDYQFNTHFLPKAQLDKHRGGYSFLIIGTNNIIAWKYLYFESDNKTISGYKDNDASNQTGSTGITFNNDRFIIRYVYGV